MPSDELVTILVVWVVLACIPAWIASTQGRSPIQWFGIGVLLSPLVAFVAVILTAPRKASPPGESQPAPAVAASVRAGQLGRCPRCGAERAGQQRFCPSCGLDYWQAAAGPARQPVPAAPMVPANMNRRGGLPGWLLVVVALVMLAGGAYVLLQAAGANLLEETGRALSDGVTQEPAANLPGRGQVWFGNSFDTDTFEIRTRTRTVTVDDTFAVVAHLRESSVASQLVLRVLLDGQVIANEQASAATGEGELYGVTLGPLFVPGTYRFEFTDVGGNELAVGQLEVTE